MIKIKVLDIIKTKNAILHKFGLQVYEHVKPYLQNNQKISLSFEGIDKITSGFSNASVGRLFMDYPNAGNLIELEGLKHIDPAYRDKIKDAINLAKDENNKIKLKNKAISDLNS